MGCHAVWKAFSRKKQNDSNESETKLARVLNLFDLTALGVGSTLGLGVYVLAGSVAYNLAGPAVTLSFLVAAIASAFAGVCYAEFAARVPKAGSAYVYSYVSVGELVAFTIGWNLILEYVIGTASVARGMSSYIDTLCNHTMENTLKELLPIKINFLGSYPDFFSFIIVMLVALLLAIGVKESSLLNNIFTTVNLLTVAIVIVAGGINANPANWFISKESIPDGVHGGEGGFMPFGIAGVMAGAAKCFYGFVGFDCVATTGEEAKNPKRNIPISIVLSLIIIFLAYFSISTVLTMMLPYYHQDPSAPIPFAFEAIGWYTIKWMVSIGAIFALCTSLLGAMFPLPRVLYAMANDGILYSFMKRIHPRFHTPLVATVFSGLFAALMAMIFDLDQLIDMMSIGTLLAYTIVAICVLILRYEVDENETKEFDNTSVMKQIINFNQLEAPSKLSSRITKVGIVIFSLFSFMFCIVLQFGTFDSFEHIGTLVPFIISILGMICTTYIIARQPNSNTELTFKVPFVPIVPCLSVLINLYLMCQLDSHTWIRFGIWLIIGYSIYFAYGVRHSTEGKRLILPPPPTAELVGYDNKGFISTDKYGKNIYTINH